MPNYTVSVAAAVAVVGADLFVGEVWARAPFNRVLTGLGLRGSAAAGDTEVEYFIDEVRVTQQFNNNTGFPNIDDLIPVDALGVPAGAQLRAVVRDAAATNPINAMISVEAV